MSAYGISIPEVAQAVAKRTKNLPGGTVEMGKHETAIRMVGEPRDPKDLGNIALKSVNGGTVYLRDIAKITPTLEKPMTLTFIDKENALVLAIKRKKNTNMIQIVDDVRRLMKEIPGPISRSQDYALFRPGSRNQETDKRTPDQRFIWALS